MKKIKHSGFIGDLLLFVILLVVFGYLTTPHNPFLTGAPVHPYLLVVVLIATRYGTFPGIKSAIILSALYEIKKE